MAQQACAVAVGKVADGWDGRQVWLLISVCWLGIGVSQWLSAAVLVAGGSAGPAWLVLGAVASKCCGAVVLQLCGAQVGVLVVKSCWVVRRWVVWWSGVAVRWC